MIVKPDIVGLQSVDIELGTWAIPVNCTHIIDINHALSPKVAHAIVAKLIRQITGVRRCVETPLIGFHDVKLGAELASVF